MNNLSFCRVAVLFPLLAPGLSAQGVSSREHRKKVAVKAAAVPRLKNAAYPMPSHPAVTPPPALHIPKQT